MKISSIAAASPAAQNSPSAQPSRITIQTNQTPNPREYVPSPVTPGAVVEAPRSEPFTAPNEPKTESTDVQQPISPHFAALAKEKRALQVRERALAEREKALSGQSGQKDQIALARIKSEPLRVLQEAGVTYDELAKAVMDNPINPELAALKAQVDALKSEQDEKFTARDRQAEQQTLREIQREAEALASQSDDFELVRLERAEPQVVRLIQRMYKETGQFLDIKDAMTMIETELFEETKRRAAAKKVQSQFSPQTSVPQRQSGQGGMRTLSNRDAAAPVLDRLARAKAVMEGRIPPTYR